MPIPTKQQKREKSQKIHNGPVCLNSLTMKNRPIGAPKEKCGFGTIFEQRKQKQAKRKKRERELPYWPEIPETPMQKYFHLWWIDMGGNWTKQNRLISALSDFESVLGILTLKIPQNR